MLNTLRKGAGTWVAKIFIALLILSFAVWGIADIFSGYGNSVLAKVGEVEIPAAKYDRVLTRQIRQISNQVGQQVSKAQARSFGLDRQVLNSLITNAAVDSHAKKLGLGISRKSIQNKIIKNPAFLDENGKFSKQQFRQVLRNNDMNETMFVADQRVGAVRDQLVLTLSSDLYTPNSMKENINRYNNNTRELDYFILPQSAVKKIADPDEKTQQAFLEGNKRSFTAPQYRKTGILTLSTELVKKSIKVSKEDIETSYNERIDQFTTPGKRHIRRMSFIDPKEAQKAYKELEGGADFMELAKKYKFPEKGTDLGFINKTKLTPQLVADTAFGLEEGKFSKPVAGNFSSVIVQVVKINPVNTKKKLTDVESEIRSFLISEKTIDKMGKLQDSIEDERAAGHSLTEIAKTLSLSYKVTEAVDRTGKGPDSKKVPDFPVSPALLKGIFASDIGVENDPVEGKGSASHWYEVLGITPERLKPLAEVKGEVVKLWKKREREKALSKMATEIIAQLHKGKTLKQLAKTYKAKVKKSKPFNRTREHDDIPASAVGQAFVLPVGGVGMNSLPEGKGRVIFKVSAKQRAREPGKEGDKKLSDNLKRNLETDLVAQYIASLRKGFGVTVNQQVLNRLNGVQK